MPELAVSDVQYLVTFAVMLAVGLFGPIIVLWFATLGGLGIVHILRHPLVLQALDPMHVPAFFTAHPALAFFSLGAAVLALTGGEALYADMGHFGRQPIKYAWFGIVLLEAQIVL